MSRPRMPLGTFGAIKTRRNRSGSYTARTAFRDEDGVCRDVTASGRTANAAESALKAKIAKRLKSGPSDELTPETPFPRLVAIWLENVKMDADLEETTKDLYEWNMTHYVLPAFKDFVLGEMTVQRCDQFLRRMRTESYSKAKQSKVVLSLALGLAVRYDALSRNPVSSCLRLKAPAKRPDALSLDEVREVRRRVREWRTGKGHAGPPPDGQLAAVIDVMLGTSCRIGEALAIRRCDVDTSSDPVVVHICGTIATPDRGAHYRKPRPKTSKSNRRIAVPSWTAAALRERLNATPDDDPETLIFRSRNGTPLRAGNVRRLLRQVMDEAEIDGLHPHKLRRTAGTQIARKAGTELASDLLGHANTEITRKHYIAPDEIVDPRTAQILESLGVEEPVNPPMNGHQPSL